MTLVLLPHFKCDAWIGPGGQNVLTCAVDWFCSSDLMKEARVTQA